MTSRPDFSPAMLMLFLRARASHVVSGHRGPCKRDRALQTFKARMRRLCRLSWQEFDLAWMGRLSKPETRARIWAVLGHFPEDHGVVLSRDDGRQTHA